MRLLRLVTKLTLTVKAAFIHKILCFEMFKIIFGQLVDRMLENKRLFACEPPPPPPPPQARRVHLWCIFLALPFRDGPLPAELNFGKNTGLDQYIVSMINICHG